MEVRLVAATHRNLEMMMGKKQFRSDLYYRLNVFPIELPALRERAEDIPLLVRHFVQRFARRLNRPIETIPAEAMEALALYSWPGNIRELQNVVERAVILSTGPVLKIPLPELKQRATNGTGSSTKQETLQETTRKHILAALEETSWVLSGPNGAARRLGLNRSTLQFRMLKLGLSRSGARASVPCSRNTGIQPRRFNSFQAAPHSPSF